MDNIGDLVRIFTSQREPEVSNITQLAYHFIELMQRYHLVITYLQQQGYIDSMKVVLLDFIKKDLFFKIV